MRKRFTGHVGDPSYAEAWRFIDSGGKGTLIALSPGNGESSRVVEKALYFGGSEVIRLTPGAEKSALEAEIAELESLRGQPFDFMEGTFPPGLDEKPGAARFPCATRTLPAEARKASSVASPAASTDRDPLVLVDALEGKTATLQAAGHLAHLELASAWRSLGSPHRAAAHLRDAGALLEAWGAADAAVKCLEESLSICPADVRSAEKLLVLLQGAGKREEAEQVAERACSLIGTWHQHDLLVRLCKVLDSATRNESLRRAEAEAMIRTGEVARGVQELAAVAALFESRGEREAAHRLNERILEIDPANAKASLKLRGRRRSLRLREQVRRWGSIAAAISLAALWIFWDIESASALEKRGPPPADLRIAVGNLRAEAARYPLTRHPARLARREEELYRKAFAEEKRLLCEALEAQKAGDTGTAYHLFGKIAKSGIIKPYVERAEVGRQEISHLDARRQALLQQAMKLLQEGDTDGSFRIYVDVLRGADRSLNASHYTVPLCIETVPQGALLEIDGNAVGRTPRCVGVPSDPASRLRLTLPGFEPSEIADPVGQAVATGSGRMSRVLAPRTAWETSGYGGILAGGESPPDGSVIVLGADGVLRAIDPRGTPRWEVPLDGRIVPTGPPVVAGPCAVLGTTQGKALGFSIASGKVLWTARLGTSGAVHLGPRVEGQIAITCGRGAALLNPLVGLVSKRFPGSAEAVGFSAWEGSRDGALLCADGKLNRVALRTGTPDGAEDLTSEPVVALVRAGETWAALGSGGGLVGYGRRRERLWSVKVPASATALRGAGAARIVLGSPDGSLIGLDATTGSPAWKTSLEGKLLALSESESGGEVILATVDRDPGGASAVAIHARGGIVLWQIPLAPGESASAHFQGQKLLVSSPSLGIKAIPMQ